MARCPSVAEVDAIAGHPDPVLRNLRITQAYHELSAAVASLGGLAASWCTFATWASKQAGQTIRREDLERAIEAELGHSDVFTRAVAGIREVFRNHPPAVEDRVISAALREACLPVRAIDETSDAVARGNRMVFAEIGREFARFVPLIRGGDADLAEVKRFCDDLRPGDLPEGQALLRAAFRDYGRALRAADGKTQAELVLLANLRISLHEQTRLQPEIAAALNAPVPELEEVKERLLARLFPEGRARRRLRARLPRSLDLKGPFDQACGRLAEQIRRSVRAVITNALMTLTLPGETLRLGADLAGSYPAHLQSIANAELSELLRGIDPTADSPRESGAQDWADLAERMHYTADFFRMRQEDAALLGPPFAADQTEAIKEGRPPSGRL